MRKILPINDCAAEGFTADQYDCISLAVAAALTHYNPDYYSYYCCYQCVAQNWIAEEYKGFTNWNNSLLKNFGLCLRPLKVGCKEEFIAGIQESIDNDSPLLMTPMYNTMFYSMFYGESEAHLSHGMLISGYDTDKDLVMLQENVHLTEYNTLGTAGTPFFTFALRTDMLFDIWKNSLAQHKSGDDILFKFVRTHEKVPKLTGLDVLGSYAGLNLSDENRFVQFLGEFNHLFQTEEVHDETLPIFLRRDFVNSLAGLLRVYNLVLSELSIDGVRREQSIAEGEKYLNSRSLIVNKLLKSLMKGTPIGPDKLTEYQKSVLNADNCFQDIVRQVIGTDRQADRRKNYALKCRAWADTERGFPRHYPAVNAVNGSWTDGKDWNCWFSTGYQPVHWWKVDLGAEPLIDEIVLRHFKGSVGNACLVNYEVSVSMDDVEYTKVITQTDNCELITRYRISPVQCRYIRLSILKPSSSGNLAALLEFEAWGSEPKRFSAEALRRK